MYVYDQYRNGKDYIDIPEGRILTLAELLDYSDMVNDIPRDEEGDQNAYTQCKTYLQKIKDLTDSTRENKSQRNTIKIMKPYFPLYRD